MGTNKTSVFADCSIFSVVMTVSESRSLCVTPSPAGVKYHCCLTGEASPLILNLIAFVDIFMHAHHAEALHLVCCFDLVDENTTPAPLPLVLFAGSMT